MRSLIRLRGERAAQDRTDSQNPEVIAAHHAHVGILDLAAASAVVDRDFGFRTRLSTAQLPEKYLVAITQILEIRPSVKGTLPRSVSHTGAVRLGGGKNHQSLWVLDRQRTQQNGIQRREHCGIGANAQRQRHQCYRREAWRPGQRADA